MLYVHKEYFNISWKKLVAIDEAMRNNELDFEAMCELLIEEIEGEECERIN